MFHNRPPQQNFSHGRHPQQLGHGQMPRFGPMGQAPHFGPQNMPQNHMPMQNVPRGTFPPVQQMPPMQQMPQMPPMHMLNPNNDPNVRFEPAPGVIQAPTVAPTLVDAGAIIIKLSDLTQGESNSLTFYENMSKSQGITKKDRELVMELQSNKRSQMQIAAGLYKDLTNSEWATKKDIRIEETRSFRADLAFALLQESRLLREASQIYADINDATHQKTMSAIIYNKIADIAHLMSI